MQTRLPTLDGLRDLAIALVLVHQLGDLQSTPDLATYVSAFVISAGWTGVQLFFVLSGFLSKRSMNRLLAPTPCF